MFSIESDISEHEAIVDRRLLKNQDDKNEEAVGHIYKSNEKISPKQRASRLDVLYVKHSEFYEVFVRERTIL